MIGLFVALMLSGPLPHKDCQKVCFGVCAWSWEDHSCHDTMIHDLGPWDPRPSPAEWEPNSYQSPPAEWGVYPCEHPPLQ